MPELAPKPLTVTIPTTQRLLGLGHTTVYTLIDDGRLKTIRIGRRRLVVYSSIEELLVPKTDGAK